MVLTLTFRLSNFLLFLVPRLPHEHISAQEDDVRLDRWPHVCTTQHERLPHDAHDPAAWSPGEPIPLRSLWPSKRHSVPGGADSGAYSGPEQPVQWTGARSRRGSGCRCSGSGYCDRNGDSDRNCIDTRSR